MKAGFIIGTLNGATRTSMLRWTPEAVRQPALPLAGWEQDNPIIKPHRSL
jgi:hypothetical protein